MKLAVAGNQTPDSWLEFKCDTEAAYLCRRKTLFSLLLQTT